MLCNAVLAVRAVFVDLTIVVDTVFVDITIVVDTVVGLRVAILQLAIDECTRCLLTHITLLLLRVPSVRLPNPSHIICHRFFIPIRLPSIPLAPMACDIAPVFGLLFLLPLLLLLLLLPLMMGCDSVFFFAVLQP